VLTAACYWPSSHCIPDQKFLSVSGELNHDRSPLAFDSDKGVCQARNQRGEIGQVPPQKFSQRYVFVRYSNKLHHFAPPKISVGCGPGVCCHSFSQFT